MLDYLMDSQTAVNIISHDEKMSTKDSADRTGKAAGKTVVKGSPNLNRLAVLKAIRTHGPVSRSDLPKMTGLSAGAVSQITAEFLSRGFISETKEKTTRSGRPRVFLKISGEGPIVVGARMTSRDTLTTTFVDLSGNIRCKAEVPFTHRDSLEALALSVAEAIGRSVDDSGYPKSQIEHVGVALPALVDSSRGVVHFMAMFPQEPVTFADILAERLDIPVTIENGTTSLARAEHWFGRAQNRNTFTLVNVGLAINSAMYSDGLLRTGAHGLAPEIGHVKTNHAADAEPCYCGAHGCGTAYASQYAIVRRAGLLDGFDLDPEAIVKCVRQFNELQEKAAAGDEAIRVLFEAAGDHLGRLVANHINLADPGFILITVPDDTYTALVETAFSKAIKDNAMPVLLALTEIRFSAQLENWHSLATAALALENF